MVIKEDESIEIEDCECGSKGIIFICFKCGRFYSDDLPDTIIRAFTEDPSILLALIKSDHFKRIDMPDE